jgi:hypothetical protein
MSLMSKPYIKKDSWNKIIQEIVDLRKLTILDTKYRLFFKGTEIEKITMDVATVEDANQWLEIWIYSIGKSGRNENKGINIIPIAVLDSHRMNEKEIRQQLSYLEVRKIDVISKFGIK